MKGQLSQQVLQAGPLVWLCVEIGLVMKPYVCSWSVDTLFWAFWASLLLALALGVHALDRWFALRPSNQANA